MKAAICVLTACVVCASYGHCAFASADSLDRWVVNDAFGVGERFDFSIGYGFIAAGSAHMEVAGLVDMGGRRVFRIVSTATSNKVFDSFYKVRDTMSTFVDALGLFSWRFEKKQREGDYQREQLVTFDQLGHVAILGDDSSEVPAYVHDVLSAFYYVRAQPLEVGDTIYVPHWSEKKVYTLMIVVEEREKIETAAGEFNCIRVRPLLQSEGLFRHEGRVSIWLTDDRLHMPVLVKSRLVVGAIHAELVAYRFGELRDE